ncbi:CTCK domain-containing protein [Meloidogyne graminicola]|uniref:CTCK domain-containing protein n=1 Tax=Meloidogyne graminicola TaxID=189291 RepID=A0A8S9ZNN2_9BILA|nr:CTCK domain-containing protein [Meloidogyne graminicola]
MSLRIEIRKSKIIFKKFYFLIFLFYSKLFIVINARPFSIADEVSSNNFNNQQQQEQFINSNEREQYREAMQIARDTFFQLRPLNNNVEQISEQRNKHKLNREKQRNKHKQKTKERKFEINKEDGNIGINENTNEQKQQSSSSSLYSTQNTMLPLHISANIVNSTLQSNTCQGDLFKHKIKVIGCKPKTITNRFCHGSCSSFYIPRLRSKKLKATFQSCSACIPDEMDTIQIKLECPDLEEGFIYQKIVRVKKCACKNIVLEGEEINEEEDNIEENYDEEED